VVHLPLNVNEGEGKPLSEKFKVGIVYPVFILTDSEGEVIRRWTGYTGGATVFINTLKSALANLSTIDNRVAKFESSPTYKDALSLAGHFSDNSEHLKAVAYYKKAVKLGKPGSYDYSLEILKNMANACWKDLIPFDEVIPAADAVLKSRFGNTDRLIKLAQIMGRLSQSKSKTDQIERYLKAALKATSDSAAAGLKQSHESIRADYTLYVEKDTAKAVEIKKASMDQGWENDRDKFYAFAKWCLERRINLDEAEMYVRKTVNLVYPGKYRAKVYNTLADIYDAMGSTDEAIKFIQMAIEQDSANEYYPEKLERFKNKTSKK
jgi:tetratricopeptide (TPR) repeat protein